MQAAECIDKHRCLSMDGLSEKGLSMNEETGLGAPTPTAAVCCAPLRAPTMSATEIAATAALFKALADPQRVRIVHLLAVADGPVCVCDLVEPLGIAQPTVSHHLRKLVEAGLLDREQRGTWAYYSLNREALRRLADVADLEGAAI
jgi:ArsR family transcriptional regulator, arsenate/arsenite/antimonite-responsive transcriptional repressor